MTDQARVVLFAAADVVPFTEADVVRALKTAEGLGPDWEVRIENDLVRLVRVERGAK